MHHTLLSDKHDIPLIVDCGRNFEGFFYDVENDFINYNTAPLNNKQIYHCYEV